jgi:hypothetical protein
MFSALRPTVKYAFWSKNGPVPARPVNAYALRGLGVEEEKEIAVPYKDIQISGQRLDLLVGGRLIVELKCVEEFSPIHEAQLLSYLNRGCHGQTCLAMPRFFHCPRTCPRKRGHGTHLSATETNCLRAPCALCGSIPHVFHAAS